MADDIPVLGAGGPQRPAWIAAAFILGARGAWLGTRFLATQPDGLPQRWLLTPQPRCPDPTTGDPTAVSRPVLVEGALAMEWAVHTSERVSVATWSAEASPSPRAMR